ncbi:hypothetical protein BC941DRAFT_218377 [Chlamydoabsidia padenii]|nr:hypothetical protein BC941DRAFT_218377 [Chlamydoabsidia padenii]
MLVFPMIQGVVGISLSIVRSRAGDEALLSMKGVIVALLLFTIIFLFHDIYVLINVILNILTISYLILGCHFHDQVIDKRRAVCTRLYNSCRSSSLLSKSDKVDRGRPSFQIIK